MDFEYTERPVGIQTSVVDTGHLSEASRMALSPNPYFIDLNLKCPSKKVVGKSSGYFLPFDLLLLKKLINKVVEYSSFTHDN